MRNAILLGIVTALSACATSGEQAAFATSSTPIGPEHVQASWAAPMFAKWRLLSDSGNELRIAAVVEKRAALDYPIDVTIEVPSGLSIRSGQTSYTIPASMPPGEYVNVFEFTYAAPPQADLKIVADISGPNMGAHAVDAYRFGREEPRAATPKVTGGRFRIGDKDFGASKPLK